MLRECAHEQHVRRTLTLTITHTITAYSVSKMSYVCAYSSVQLDKSRVEKEFTADHRMKQRDRHRPPWTLDNWALMILVGWLTGGTGL